MRLAFALFKYFPYGGLQRDCIKIAQECVRRGHQVDIYCMEWSGPQPAKLNVEVLPIEAWPNYRRYEKFSSLVREYAAEKDYDALVGFNRMPGLDFYFGADPSFALKLKQKPFWYKYLPRSRSFLDAERGVFGRESKTRIFMLSDMEIPHIQQYYRTPSSRFFLLPPGVEKDRLAPSDYVKRRIAFRNKLDVKPDQKLLLMVGSGFRIKGLDRALEALARLPSPLREKSLLMILGRDNQKPFERQAEKLGLAHQVRFMGGRDDVADFLFSADLLVHPAYRESAGMILVEAIAARLPVLVTDTCGYSFHIKNSGAGRVHSSPFNLQKFSQNMSDMLTLDPSVWQKAADDYLHKTDLFGLAERAADIIEGKVLTC
ncbi:glycosyltransferase family 4 protein [Geoalkalibacter subterraneus]|uniref:Glucosyltransferase I RfaG n=1 Tax=Geoalkalibacter subterraneus TaxID=483547 RepID=A0A0B5FWK5_9BACT|nr:glycosyltransferase family 4 protein [Geoalkalibacter subterraneus]AJF08006.1 hypothetical protein GSUB_10385 [Geoalkalibacter subterraneus]